MSDKDTGAEQKESRAENEEPRAEEQGSASGEQGTGSEERQSKAQHQEPKGDQEPESQQPKAQKEKAEGDQEPEVPATEPKYQEIGDLPETLRATLPEEAQHTYLDAYQDAWDNYTEERGGEAGREAVAHRDAMTAVQKDFVHDSESGKWRRRGEGADTEREKGLIERIREML